MKKYSNILCYSLINLGDVVLTTAAIALLRQAYPEAKITMLVKPQGAPAVINNPLIDEVIVYDYKSKSRFQGVWNMLKTLRTRRFDISFAFDLKLRSAVLTWLAGIPVRVGPEFLFDTKPRKVIHLFTHVISIPHIIQKTLRVETFQAIVRGFTGMEGSAKPVFADIMPENIQKAQDLFGGLPAAKYKVALCVKGTFALKNWSPQRFARLVDILAQKYDAAFYIIGAPGDKDYAGPVIELARTPIANFCGKTSVVDLAAVLKYSDLFITVDTGAAHIAATTGVPMVTIFGCTSPLDAHPISDKSVVAWTNEPCCPCGVRENECPEHRCMDKIQVEDVLSLIDKVVSWESKKY
ncbi:Hypothetical protein LUCI_4597 [Lucifera butyrica]|uniref:Glycosyltransferase family 9 protein n=1 Tax=Lucifera butyrica TaxID=1351585 RepID=A0A498REE2_9FIRM|nr:glycosyltransferase family 9 protein [Lucifera butyrica]VBB09307.1 Hypothetical protein LUCI_4597 [Lucifera butyrica]